MTKWLPASWKTTRAKEQVKSWWFKRVNKDDLREMIDWWRRSKRNEKTVLSTRDHIIYTSLMNGTWIIVDDTNFEPRHEETLRKLAEECWAKFVIKEFDTPLETCLERDAKREKPVWQKIIMEMYYKYVRKEQEEIHHNPELPDCIICDIDGTLAKKWDRNVYDDSKIHLDTIIQPVKDILCMNRETTPRKIIIFTWRMDRCEQETIKRLKDNNIPFDELHMRKTDDVRKDSIVKREMYDEFIKDKYNVLYVIDDRQQVVRMRRDLWLFVFDVNQTGQEF